MDQLILHHLDRLILLGLLLVVIAGAGNAFSLHLIAKADRGPRRIRRIKSKW
jgi:hypothetical protein